MHEFDVGVRVGVRFDVDHPKYDSCFDDTVDSRSIYDAGGFASGNHDAGLDPAMHERYSRHPWHG